MRNVYVLVRTLHKVEINQQTSFSFIEWGKKDGNILLLPPLISLAYQLSVLEDFANGQ